MQIVLFTYCNKLNLFGYTSDFFKTLSLYANIQITNKLLDL